jgi:succinate dehydrogenase/fumarate reductase flavoprotein subunit
VPGLFAGGESAGGVHGASRIAGNGCAETLVFGALAGRTAAAEMLSDTPRDWPKIEDRALASLAASGAVPVDTAVSKERIRDILTACAGIWRDGPSLREGMAGLEAVQHALAGHGGPQIADAVERLEAQRMALVARTVVAAALTRNESRGAHQRTDHPGADDVNWLRHTVFRRGTDGGLIEESLPIH